MNALLAPLAHLCAARSRRQQRSSALWNPELWGASVNSNGNLELDGVDIPALVAEYGSPLMAVSRSKLRRDAAALIADVDATSPGALVAFSYKTNCIPGVLRELHSSSFAAEVISPYELWLAERLGMSGDRIIVNGVNKDFAYLREAVRVGACINIDDRSEIQHIEKAAGDLGRRARVSLRLSVDNSHFGLDISAGEAYEAASAVLKGREHLEFSGLHFHSMADNDDPQLHIACMKTALRFAMRIRRRLGLTTRTLNIGGGYTVPTMKVMSRLEYARQRLLGIPCRPPDPRAGMPFRKYLEEVANALRAWCAKHALPLPRLILEPGRIVTSQSHVMLTSVHSIKHERSGHDIAMTDAGKILTSYPCDYEYHQMFVANRMHDINDASYILMGRLCTSADWLARHRCLPRLQQGDAIAIMDAGAYFTSYSSNFSFPRPQIVMLDGGDVRTLRKRETFEHLTAMDDFGRTLRSRAAAL